MSHASLTNIDLTWGPKREEALDSTFWGLTRGTFIYATIGIWRGLYYITSDSVVMIKAKPEGVGEANWSTGTTWSLSVKAKDVIVITDIQIIMKGTRDYHE